MDSLSGYYWFKKEMFLRICDGTASVSTLKPRVLAVDMGYKKVGVDCQVCAAQHFRQGKRPKSGNSDKKGR
jgi:hypothetical protein